MLQRYASWVGKQGPVVLRTQHQSLSEQVFAFGEAFCERFCGIYGDYDLHKCQMCAVLSTTWRRGTLALRSWRPCRAIPWSTPLGAGTTRQPSAASGNVCPGEDAAESFVIGVVVAPDDVPADHAALLFVGGVVGAVEGEVSQRGELRLHAV